MVMKFNPNCRLKLFKNWLPLLVFVAFLMETNGTAITISQVTGTFSNATGDVNIPPSLLDVNLIDNVPGSGFGAGLENQVRWGISLPPIEQSGLGFTGAAPPALSINVGEQFEIGQLRHFNTPILIGTGVETVDLQIDIGFSNPGGVSQTFDFSLGIFEGNNGLPFPNSDDTLSFNNAFASEYININGVAHTLEVLGFSVNGSLANELRSPEDSISSALVVGRIVETPVPEPSTISLVAIGFGGLMLGFRRRLKQ